MKLLEKIGIKKILLCLVFTFYFTYSYHQYLTEQNMVFDLFIDQLCVELDNSISSSESIIKLELKDEVLFRTISQLVRSVDRLHLMFVGIPYTSYSLVYPTTASQLDDVASLIRFGTVNGEIPPFGWREEKKEAEIRFISLLHEKLVSFREFFLCYDIEQSKKISRQQYEVILRDHYYFRTPLYHHLLEVYEGK